ncbi:response regulator [Thermanaerosceptrum fracticalcis]|uniref:Stage 0 sporulation protein A homolog n=2 Tax=Thermanaerosceptrum fracticalcis TaxID=1712410 RepID=A0A7G6DYW6_THEFR|nr:response regulator [Thermanaerosceptrum fracticalcis]
MRGSHMTKYRILVADDEEIILRILSRELKNEGYLVDAVSDGEEACKKVQANRYDAAVLDIRMPKKDGIQVLNHIKSITPETIVVIMTAFGTIDNAVETMKKGAYDYITKPFDNNDLLLKIRQAFTIKEKIGQLVGGADDLDVDLVGESRELARLKEKIQKIKDLDTTVLLTGESGTGKSLVAKVIHQAGNRKEEPFIHINCATLPANLMESELFGHEKGAFTGALESKKGKFELAGKGTIFLDEISTLTPSLQAKLLNVLQEKKMERIGGSRSIAVNARIIAATNEILEDLVRRRVFREDLYYRINVVTLECPPLRYRQEDIEPLARYFLNKINKKLGKNVVNISPEVMCILRNYDWPGNIRELENTLESAIALANGDTLHEDDLPLRISSKVKNQNVLEVQDNRPGMLEIQEIEAIKRVLAKYKGHREKAAQELGISRRTLQYKLKKYDLL